MAQGLELGSLKVLSTLHGSESSCSKGLCELVITHPRLTGTLNQGEECSCCYGHCYIRSRLFFPLEVARNCIPVSQCCSQRSPNCCLLSAQAAPVITHLLAGHGKQDAINPRQKTGSFWVFSHKISFSLRKQPMQMQQCGHLEWHQPFGLIFSVCSGIKVSLWLVRPPQHEPEASFTPLKLRATLNLLALLLKPHCTGIHPTAKAPPCPAILQRCLQQNPRRDLGLCPRPWQSKLIVCRCSLISSLPERAAPVSQYSWECLTGHSGPGHVRPAQGFH